MIPTNYYGAPTFGAFYAKPYICQSDNCATVQVQDNSYWATYLFRNIQNATISITKSGSGSTPIDVNLTSDFLTSATGTVVTDGTANVVGTNTLFTTEFRVGDYLVVEDTDQVIEIESIQSNTQLTLVTWADTASGSDISKSFVIKDLTASDLGLSSISDGVYDIVYVIQVEDGASNIDTFTYQGQQMFICNVECCVNSMLSSISDYYDCNNCDDSYIRSALASKGLLESMKRSMSAGDLVSAETILTTLQSLCDYEDCKCN